MDHWTTGMEYWNGILEWTKASKGPARLDIKNGDLSTLRIHRANFTNSESQPILSSEVR